MFRINAFITKKGRLLSSVIGVLSSIALTSGNVNADTISGSCNPVRQVTCALPFPSDLFTEDDQLSPTGRRVVVPNHTFELLKNETDAEPVPLVDSVRPESFYAGASGFSAATPVLFELARPAKEDTLPLDGGTVIRVYELGNPNPVPVRAGIMEAARTKRVKTHGERADIVEAWPRSRWKFGTQYVALLTKDIKPLMGSGYEVSDGMQSVLDGASTEVATAYEPVLDFLDQPLADMNMSRDDILAVTYFTVRDEAEVVLPMARVMQKNYAEDHAIKDWKVEHHSFKYKAAIITGKVRLSNYRLADGSIVLDPNHPAEDNWVDFRLTVPNNAHKKPAPIIVYGHGLTANKETMSLVDQSNAIRNIATLAIDQPNHGTRIEKDGGYIMDILVSDKLQNLVGLIAQSSIDMVSVVAAIEQHIQHLDVLPRNKDMDVFPWLALRGQDQIPDIDTSKIFYQGTSLGGVLGSSFLGASPKIDGAFLHVPGVGITNILSHSILWAQFQNLAPENVKGAELAAYFGMIQQLIDYGDGINFMHRADRGLNILPYPAEPYPLGVVYALGDGVVFNGSSVALSEIAGLPLARPASDNVLDAYEQLPMEKLPNGQWFDSKGNGVRMIEPPSLPISDNSLLGILFRDLIGDANAGLAHLAFEEENAKEYQEAWVQANVQNYGLPEE